MLLEAHFIVYFVGLFEVRIILHYSAQIGFGPNNFGSDRIRISSIDQLSDCNHPIQSDAHL